MADSIAGDPPVPEVSARTQRADQDSSAINNIRRGRDGRDTCQLEPSARSSDTALDRWFHTSLAVLLVIGFFVISTIYWVPAHPGVDQNGYLVGGRMLAENLTMRLIPTRPGTASTEFDPHQFVGRMWVGADFGTPQERYYPKYPIGLPALVAAALWVGGQRWGPLLAYWINPVAMSLAVLATFLLLRLFVRSLWAFCAAAVFAFSPVIGGCTTNPNSHATATCAVAWGMYLLLNWWQGHGAGQQAQGRTDRQRRSAIPWLLFGAGLLLGSAATIRYTEALLILPLLTVVLLKLQTRSWRSWGESAWALFGWLIPVALLLSYNLASMGRLTGYDGTNESIGFSLQYAQDNWETTIRQLGSVALYFVFPFSLIGLLAMLSRSWRLGLIMAMWILPCLIVYTCYYWAPDPVPVQQTMYIGYMRFFTTILPALLLCAFWLFDQSVQWLDANAADRWPARLARASFAGVTGIAVAVHAHNTAFNAESDQYTRLMLRFNTDEVLAVAPAGAVVFAQDNGLLHHLQFVRDYKLYSGETFNKWFIDNLPRMDPDEPQGWDPGRRDSLYRRLKDHTQAQLDEQQRRLISQALDSGRRVFVVVQRRDTDPPLRRRSTGLRGSFGGMEILRRLNPDKYDLEVLSAWATPVVRPVAQEPGKRRPRRAELRLDRRQMFWQIVEVMHKPPPPPKPASGPSSKPLDGGKSSRT
ncbi:hypothetical protein [Fontivita pretiosa]|uniref:hypothetical protein n=1 Tax=Fontivita pretiosa TaxID=2989684 RepID=UPI003D17BBA8